MRNRCIISNVKPQLEGGTYYIKRVAGESVTVSATIFADSEDSVKAVLAFKHLSEKKWSESPMTIISRDNYEAEFTVQKSGFYQYKIIAWCDDLQSWHRVVVRKKELGQLLKDDFYVGSHLLKEAASSYSGNHKQLLDAWSTTLGDTSKYEEADKLISLPDFEAAMERYSIRKHPTEFDCNLRVRVSSLKEQYSTWYMLFPRSTGVNGEAGNFITTEKLLPRLEELGFDTLLLPPIFPIGKTNRKGPNNSKDGGPANPGSPWAVGNEHGGHKTVNPELGTLKDFEKLVKSASKAGIDIALDLGLRCSPDHPYVKEHPDWFKHLPDGRLELEEVPPLQYSDIINFDFECEDSKGLWEELKSVVEFWIDKGIKTFYTSTPHYKPFNFWHWLIEEIHKEHPEVVFLSGALDRNLIIEELAKTGFNQSLTYFIWKESKKDIKAYIQDIVHGQSSQYMVPNFFVNTPDILPSYLDNASENMYMIRYSLAATLASNCGLYGPVYELMTGKRHPDSKERYLHSEKYEIATHNWETRSRLTDFISKINKTRRENEALQTAFNLTFSQTDNDQLISFLKTTHTGQDAIWCIINLDPEKKQGGYVEVPRKALDLKSRWINLQVTELLTGEVYHWFNDWNYVELNPSKLPIHIFRVNLGG